MPLQQGGPQQGRPSQDGPMVLHASGQLKHANLLKCWCACIPAFGHPLKILMLCEGTMQCGCPLIGNSMLCQSAFRPKLMLCLGTKVKQLWGKLSD